jgi:hypothetical protein
LEKYFTVGIFLMIYIKDGGRQSSTKDNSNRGKRMGGGSGATMIIISSTRASLKMTNITGLGI